MPWWRNPRAGAIARSGLSRFGALLCNPMEKAVPLPLNRLPRAFLRAAQRFNENQGFVLSSHVAMSMMLALFPFVLFVVALAGALSRGVDINDLIELIFGLWPEEIAEPIVTEIRKVLAADSVRLMTIGGVLALWFASNGVEAVRVAISKAYRDTDPRPFWKTRLLSVCFVLVGGVAMILLLTLGVAMPAYVGFLGDAVPPALLGWTHSRWMTLLATVFILMVVVAACHIVLPGQHHRLRDVWPGVVLTVVMWFAAVWAFSIYVTSFASYSATYAGLAGAMAALIFLYMIAAILILGAEFNGVILRWRAKNSG